ncbi:ABC transporter permease [Streptomyces sp. XM4193]|uniref:ABC transporter permease n=1 Tax=Streptomyces sp. XM4193 TaxID=2929782 RepID=UPI001FFB16A3|nr:ABC transporter permease [Streptomyces sp. XM4193]MCK1798419.1 ABC transporter permease [Streptomyces sp. XM4193]
MPTAVTTENVGVAPSAVPRTRSLLAVLRAEGRLFLREPGSAFWVLLFPAALLTIIGLIPSMREVSEDLGGRRVVDIYLPVVILLAMITAGVQVMAPLLAGYRERGVLRRMSTTPVSPGVLLAAQMVINGVAMLVAAVLATVVGGVGFDVPMPQNPVGHVLVLLLSLACSLSLGAALSALARTTRAATTLGLLVYFPAMFTVGVWLPVQAMPDIFQSIVEFTPFGAASQAFDQASLGDWPSTGHLLVITVWTVLTTAVAVRFFRWE